MPTQPKPSTPNVAAKQASELDTHPSLHANRPEPPTSPVDLHHRALSLYRTGRLSDALTLLHRAISLDPANPAFHNTLGVVLAALGALDQSIASFETALRFRPNDASAASNLGNALRRAGRVDDAGSAYRRAISLNPNLADAHNNLGVLLHQRRSYQEAADAFTQAARFNSDSASVQANLADALRAAGQFEPAADAARKAISLDPNCAQAHCHLGAALIALTQYDQAAAALQKAISLRPLFPAAHNNLATVLLEQKRVEEARRSAQTALAMNPDFPEALHNLGRVDWETEQYEQAEAHHARAVQLRPDYCQSHYSLGVVRRELGKVEQAIASYQRVLELDPDQPEARFNLGYIQLLDGDYASGWKGYDARWESKDRSALRHFPQPRWTGSSPRGKRILLWPEQGLGTLIQFIRFAHTLADLGASVIVQCPGSLRRLFQTCTAIDQVLTVEQALPDFDFHCPLPSVAATLGTSLADLPGRIPYLHPKPSASELWESRVASHAQPGRIKVGLVWAGNPKQGDDRHRSFRLQTMAPLAQVQNAAFFSLQKGDPARQAHSPPPGFQLTDLTEDLEDLADTAALISALDLVITSDTSVAHLAGALGKPTWVALKFAPDWRWLRDRHDSPWYPDMRLFRQLRRGDWQAVFAVIAQALHEFPT